MAIFLAVLRTFRPAWLAIVTVGVTATAIDAVGQQSKSAAPSPITLEAYAAQNNLEEPAGVQFVSLRCASLYSFTSGYLREQYPDAASTLEQRAKFFITVALKALKGNEALVRDQMGRMGAMYSDRAKAAKAATNNILDDAVISSDLKFCNEIAS